MSWRLDFYRRVGEAELAIEEVDRVFERMPRFTRISSQEEDPEAYGPVTFRYHDPSTEASFDFIYHYYPLQEEEGQEPAEVDFPYEITPLEARLETLNSPELAREAMPIIVDVCRQLHLLAVDQQVDQQEPCEPRVEDLIRSYNAYGQAVEETLAYMRRAGRKHAIIASVLLLTALVLWLLFVLGR